MEKKELVTGSIFWRRLSAKMQVFPDFLEKGYSSRQSHSQMVCDVALSLCERLEAFGLSCNQEVVAAACLAHDLGQPPGAHVGEGVIWDKSGKKFRHADFSAAIARIIGLDENTVLCVKRHSFSGNDLEFKKDDSIELKIVAWSDKIAYVFGDYQDALKEGFLNDACIDLSLDECLAAFAEESKKNNQISFSKEAQRFRDIRKYMYENLYYKVNRQDFILQLEKAYYVVSMMCDKGWLGEIKRNIAFALLTDAEARKLSEMFDGSRLDSFFLLSEDFFDWLAACRPFIRQKKEDNKIIDSIFLEF